MSLPSSVIGRLSIPQFHLPNIPILMQAENIFRAQLNKMYESIPNVPTMPNMPAISPLSVQLNQLYEKTMLPSIPSISSLFGEEDDEKLSQRKRKQTDDFDSEIEPDYGHTDKKPHIDADPNSEASISGTERNIKAAKSIKERIKKRSLSAPIIPFVEQFASAVNRFWARGNSSSEQDMEAQNIKSKLTAELVAAAKKTEETLRAAEFPVGERRDFFLQTRTLDSQFHQVYIIVLC